MPQSLRSLKGKEASAISRHKLEGDSAIWAMVTEAPALVFHSHEDASESGYFAVRGMLATSVTEAARFIAERGVIKESGPVLVRFITQVASRFGVVVTQKVAAQALPVVGALGGAAVNYAFI